MINSETLDAIAYLPVLRTRQAELRGFRELAAATKASLIPMLALGKLGQLDDAQRVLEKVREITARCFVDLHPTTNQACANFEHLVDPAGSYAAWRGLFQAGQDVVPVALLRQGGTERPFVRQVLAIEKDHGVVVIRSRRGAHDLSAMQAALSAVDDVNNILIVLDFGYVRGAVDLREVEARHLISALRTVDSAARIAVAGSSYPKAVSAYGDESGTLDIEERDLHAQIGGDDVAIYADHSSIYPEPFEPTISRFVPRIDYSLEDSWLYRRHRAESGGYPLCAQELMASPDWDADFAQSCWGAAKIVETAGGIPPGFGSPQNWIAARVNMHIERQHALSRSPVEDEEID